ncbi:histidine kinase [Streptomyces sp. YIM 130001]|uniref:sensor histidine kinase n=1 Tax=Streptomyces sp. YIM 130001 TaxID=2259644 RepID=UPI001F08BDC1|nr:histidine kinase [Streptomyces sp. YIM 130001]
MDRIRRAGPWAVDISVALLVQVAVTIPYVVPRPAGSSPADWLDYLVTTVTVLPLVGRRRAPVLVLVAVVAAHPLLLLTDAPGQPLPYTTLLALYTVAAQAPACTRRIAGAGVLAIIFPSVSLNTGEARELLFTLFVHAAAYVLGRLTDVRQAYARALTERAAQLERTNRIEAEQARDQERARIAREMHDILSHAVTLMLVQAESGPVAVRAAPERAEAAFEAISATGRDAMTQLRRMLGVLRDAPDDTERDRSPQPTLAELPELVERLAAGGRRVSYEVSGAARRQTPDIEAAVHRIVQEALTNTVKHAGDCAVSIRLVHGSDSLEVTVLDDGPGPGGEPGQGHGLIGMRERAAAHGGTLRTGPGPDGTGFEVTAHFLLPRTGASGTSGAPGAGGPSAASGASGEPGNLPAEVTS